mmetsp:Transcript_3314/g.4845  ORF Transcript_3314/g.4845 Transcript_3314/m.4845 type:complete len:101 (-) Transcript_3314:85-387(-)
MHTIRIKVVDESHILNTSSLIPAVTKELHAEGISIYDNAPLTLKVKSIREDHKEKILLQLRETETKQKLNEKVIPYITGHYLKDVAAEAHALITTSAVPA